MLSNLNPLKKRVDRAIRRVSADVRRPLQSLHTDEGLRVEADSLYEPLLHEGYIRLLTVLRVDDTSVHCTLRTYQQRLAPRYDAISYCWGTNTTSTSITCNGLALEVRQSVITLLKTCLQRDHPDRPIWIDAICLNQKNSDEKAIHVPLMGEIYRLSTRTIVWLGEPDDTTEDTIDFIKTMIKFLTRKDVVKVLNNPNIDEDLNKFGSECFGEEIWSMKWLRVRKYLGRPWFRRLWTVQEVLLPWNVQIMCGTTRFNMIPWKDLVTLFDVVSKVGEGVILYPEGGEGSHGSGLSQMVNVIEGIRALLRRKYPSMYVLKEFCQDRACQEPVDRLWGLLGLMPPELVARIKDAKIIDYTESGKRQYWKSYLAFMKILYAHDREDFIYTLFADIGRGKTSPLPSWCLDFNAPRTYSSFESHRSFRAGFVGPQDRTTIQSQFSLNESADTLSINALMMECVSQISTEYPSHWKTGDEDDVQRFVKEISLFLRQCFRLLDSTEYEKGSIEVSKALCSTLFAVDRPGDTEYISTLLDVPDKLDQLSQVFEMENSQLEAIPEAEKEDWLSVLEHESVLFNAACENRRVFVTEQGRIGLGPQSLQAGDLICAFPGAGPLFALRPVEEGASGRICFKLIGDTYVYGMMFGEAFEHYGRARMQTLSLI